jgi:prevent-host-death family protein
VTVLAEIPEYPYILDRRSAAVRTFRAADLTRHTGDLFEAATREPVAITKHRKLRFVVMSYDRFEELTRGASQRVYYVDELPADIGVALDEALDRALEDD